MRIITLGTSHGDATYCRFNSSTVYEINGVHYLFDCGAPVDALLTRNGLDSRRIRACFMTHMHGDHVGGLPTLIKALVKYKKKGISAQFTHFFLPEENVLPGLQAWLSVMHLQTDDSIMDFTTVKAGEVYRDENITVNAIATQHLRNPEEPDKPITFAYEILAEGKRILHTGDLHREFIDFPKEALQNHYDLCLCEATHYEPKTAAPVFEKCLFDRLIFVHIHNPWHGKDGEKALLSHYTNVPYPITVAHDGDEFTV